jgi:hypothetical protein
MFDEKFCGPRLSELATRKYIISDTEDPKQTMGWLDGRKLTVEKPRC